MELDTIVDVTKRTVSSCLKILTVLAMKKVLSADKRARTAAYLANLKVALQRTKIQFAFNSRRIWGGVNVNELQLCQKSWQVELCWLYMFILARRECTTYIRAFVLKSAKIWVYRCFSDIYAFLFPFWVSRHRNGIMLDALIIWMLKSMK